MFGKLISENKNYSVELSWYNQNGLREVIVEPLSATEECKDFPPEGHIFDFLQSEYINQRKNPIDNRFSFGNNCFYQTYEVYSLLDGLKGDAALVPVFLACVFGLSLQEVLTLTWTGIDLNYNEIIVTNGMTTRMIRLSPTARDFFVGVKAWHTVRCRDSSIDGPLDGHHVCVNEEGIPFDAEDLCHRLQIAIQKKSLPPITFDNLRLSSAMIMQHHGYSIPEIWSWLGQNNAYFDVLPLSYCQWTEQT